MFAFAPNYALRSLVTATSRATAVLTRLGARSKQIRSLRAALSTYACRCSIFNNRKPRLLAIVVRGAASKASFEAQLTNNGHELVDIKRAYLKLARDFHPDGAIIYRRFAFMLPPHLNQIYNFNYYTCHPTNSRLRDRCALRYCPYLSRSTPTKGARHATIFITSQLIESSFFGTCSQSGRSISVR